MSAANDELPRIFDAHVHVDKGLHAYDLPLAGKNVIFNDLDSYRRQADLYRSKDTAISLIVDTSGDIDFVRAEAAGGRVDALKIHSRISKLRADDWKAMVGRIAPFPAQLPVIMDAFYFGADLEFQPRLEGIIGLISAYPERKFVVAHSGGYRMLEYFFHLREFTNCYYELALSLQYLEDSSVMPDLQKLIRFTDKSRILYGSDFPFASPEGQAKTMLRICRDLALADADIDKIMCSNAASVFGKGDHRA